jgi:hypothetical protein
MPTSWVRERSAGTAASLCTDANEECASALNALGTSGPNPQFASFTFYINSGTVYARDNSINNINYSGTVALVINNVLTAYANEGGTLFFKNGVHPTNSITTETQTGWTNYSFGIGILANAQAK